MNDWIKTHDTVNEETGLRQLTEVLELPHGCLVRSTTVQRGRFSQPTAATQTFVPSLKLERAAGAVSFGLK